MSTSPAPEPGFSHAVARVASPPWLTLAAAIAALVVHLLLGGVYAMSVLLAPLWAVLVLVAFWLVLLVGGLVLARRHSLLVLLVPVAAALVWLLALSAGDAWLGWTA